MVKLLQQWELRCRKSRYFSKNRTQPFIILFMSAIIAFKRLAKKLKGKAVAIRKREFLSSTKKSYLELEVKRASATRVDAKFGAASITMTSIKPQHETLNLWRDIDTGYVFPDKESAIEAEKRIQHQLKRPFIPARTKKSKIIAKQVIQQVDKYTNDCALNNTERRLNDFEKKIKKAENKILNKKGNEDVKKYAVYMRERQELLTKKFDLAAHNALDSESIANSGVNLMSNPTDNSGGAATNTNTTPGGGISGNEEKVSESYIEYIKGTEIYYGSSVALRGKHGGCISFLNKNDIACTAFKTISTARFVILKSSDLGNKNVVRYGDAVWLQAGNSEVLGAKFSGTIQEGSGRKLKPTLINCKRNNMFKAQQYGRWIVVNKSNPSSTVGKTVLHQDDIMLEQEWYFLGSKAPNDCHMWHVNTSIDSALQRSLSEAKKARDENARAANEEKNEFSAAIGGEAETISSSIDVTTTYTNTNTNTNTNTTYEKKKPKRNPSEFDDEAAEARERNKVDFFSAGPECTWSIQLVGVSHNNGSGENKRAALLSQATDQITESTLSRRHAASTLLVSLNETIPENLIPDSLRTTALSHKQTEYLKQKSYIQKFIKLSSKGFSHQPSLKFIENLYGRNSLIYLSKKEVQGLREKEIGIEKPPINYIDVITQNRKEISHGKYWEAAQKLLIKTETWATLDHGMRQFYHIDFKKKVAAAKIMQRIVRNFMKSRWKFDREMQKTDENVLIKRHKMLLTQRHALVDDDEERKIKEQQKAMLFSNGGDGTSNIHGHNIPLKRVNSTGKLGTTDGHQLTLNTDNPVHHHVHRIHGGLEGETSASVSIDNSFDGDGVRVGILGVDDMVQLGIHEVDDQNEYDDDIDDNNKVKEQNQDFFITRGKSHRLIKISNVENDIIDMVHTIDKDPMREFFTKNEQKKRADIEAKEEEKIQFDKFNGQGLDNSQIRPLPKGNKILRRSASAIMPCKTNNINDNDFFHIGHTANDKTDAITGKSLFTNIDNDNGNGNSNTLTPTKSQTRPLTAVLSERELARNQRENKYILQLKKTKEKIGLSSNNIYGLPDECFDDILMPSKPQCGIKFLRTQGTLSGDYNDLRIKRRHHSHHSAGARHSSNSNSRSAIFNKIDFTTSNSNNNNNNNDNNNTTNTNGNDGARPSTASSAMHLNRNRKKIPAGQRVDMRRPISSTAAKRK